MVMVDFIAGGVSAGDQAGVGA